jgi:predicted O-methyltransferase YrrM
MKRSCLGHTLAACGLAGVLTCAAIGGETVQKASAAPMPASEKQSREFRENFIKSFKRIGLNTTPGDAALLRILVEGSKAKRGIEVGTCTGYGSILMGMAFERNGGHLTTIDIDPKMVAAARENLAKVGLEKTVTVVEGDALKVLAGLEGQYDFMFIDALKQDYLKYFQLVEAKLKPGAIIVADNVIKSARAMQDFLGAMEKNPDYHMVIIRSSLEKGDGMAVIYKLK